MCLLQRSTGETCTWESDILPLQLSAARRGPGYGMPASPEAAFWSLAPILVRLDSTSYPWVW